MEDIFKKRRSVRKFKPQMPPKEDLEAILEAAILAPSGKNLQNWHFVVVTNPDKIDQMAQAIVQKNARICENVQNPKDKKSFEATLGYSTFFKGAPVCILVLSSDYPITGLDMLRKAGLSQEEVFGLQKAAPGIQGVSAAIENLQLKAAQMGYGTCWMTGPNYAAKEILKACDFQKEGYFLVAMMPLGIPFEEVEYHHQRKSLDQVCTFIE